MYSFVVFFKFNVIVGYKLYADFRTIPFVFHVLAKAVIQTSTDFGNQTINIGQSNEYVCIAEGQPKPLVTWKIFDGEDANKTLVQSQGMASLKIQNAQMKDTNNYVCIAENIGGKSYKMMSLIVACKFYFFGYV